MHLSYWERSTYFDDLHLLIVGSGIVGLCSAIAYKKEFPKHKVLVIERGIFPSGASSKNAGFACFGSISELMDDFENMDEEIVWQTVAMRLEGLEKLKSIVSEEKLQYENVSGYEIFDNKSEFNLAHEKMTFLNDAFEKRFHLKNVYGMQENTFGFKGIEGIIKNKFECAINTGSMMEALLSLAKSLGVLILNGLNVASIHDNGNGVSLQLDTLPEVKAKKVLLATNGFAKQLFPELEVSANRSQVLVTKPIKGDLPFNGTFHYDKGYYYFRHTSDNRVLIGGGRNLNFDGERTFDFGNTEQIQNAIEDLLHRIILPETKFEVDYRWSGIMGLGSEKKPIIKHLSNNVICAVRLGGMGVAIGSIVAEKAVILIKE
jgi:gamma-glutamylputrescine oxidase